MTTVKINLRDYALSIPELDNLATEFYGQCLTAVGPGDESEYGFEDSAHAALFRTILNSTFKLPLP